MKSQDMQIAETEQKAAEDRFYEEVVSSLKDFIASVSTLEPYCWIVSGCSIPFYGEFAEVDAKIEAKRIGGTCEAFPLYKKPPTTEINMQLLERKIILEISRASR